MPDPRPQRTPADPQEVREAALEIGYGVLEAARRGQMCLYLPDFEPFTRAIRRFSPQEDPE